jgi:hypothetical protein
VSCPGEESSLARGVTNAVAHYCNAPDLRGGATVSGSWAGLITAQVVCCVLRHKKFATR